jgi:hypothetical protein
MPGVGVQVDSGFSDSRAWSSPAFPAPAAQYPAGRPEQFSRREVVQPQLSQVHDNPSRGVSGSSICDGMVMTVPGAGLTGAMVLFVSDQLRRRIKPAGNGLQFIIPFLYRVGLILPNQATACGRQRIVHRPGRIKRTERTEE